MTVPVELPTTLLNRKSRTTTAWGGGGGGGVSEWRLVVGRSFVLRPVTSTVVCYMVVSLCGVESCWITMGLPPTERGTDGQSIRPSSSK